MIYGLIIIDVTQQENATILVSIYKENTRVVKGTKMNKNIIF